MSNSIVLSSNYLPPVSYFHAIAQTDGQITLDKYEHFPKQTYRNRTQLATANGILNLFIPIQHGRKTNVPMQDVRISYDHEWQRLHWLSIQTAYRSSAYFEYYEDDFRPFYEKKYEFLIDYNLDQLQLCLKAIKLKKEIVFTESYSSTFEDKLDLRTLIHPKKESIYINPKPYYQIFEERTGFIPNVSIIDLICNQGPQSKNFL